MPKPGFYAVRIGRKPGIYQSWSDCEDQIKGFPGSRYKKFASRLEAQNFINDSTSAIGTPSISTSENSKFGEIKNEKDIGETENESGWDIVYSDGACKGNGKLDPVAGIGIWWGHEDARNLAERCPGDQTNNRAELIAIFRVLETTPLTTLPLLIKTDSKYSINCFETWIHKWVRDNWKTSNGQPVKNMGIIRCISKNLEIRARYGQKVRLRYVKGHSGEQGNEGADFLANQGTHMPPVQERNWSLLEEQMEEYLSKVVPTAKSQLTPSVGGQSSSKVHVETVSRRPEEAEPEPPAKRLRISHPSLERMNGVKASKPSHPEVSARTEVPEKIQPSPGSLGSRSSVQVLYVAPPLVPVRVEDIDPEDYVDCLLDNDELAKELLD